VNFSGRQQAERLRLSTLIVDDAPDDTPKIRAFFKKPRGKIDLSTNSEDFYLVTDESFLASGQSVERRKVINCMTGLFIYIFDIHRKSLAKLHKESSC